MKAMLIDENKNFNWTEVPDHELKTGEVIIETHATALNRADILQRVGKYPPPPGWPEWMGLEVSGVIAKAAPGSSWQKGDEVCALLGGGGYAEKVAVPEGMVMPIPKGLSMVEAAALPEAAATSYLNLFIEGKLEEGDTIYIAAGASGLASMAIPMAKACGARVITSVLSDDIAESIKHLEADLVVNSSKNDLAEIAQKLAEKGEPIKVAMDCLGGEMLGKILPFMADDGYWILISTLAGVTTEISLRPLLTKGIHLVGSMLRKRTSEMKARILSELVTNIWPKIESGKIKPYIYKTLPITEAAAAHAILENGENIGKVVLTVK
jgi:putative PIG3 family NAD(P)H quinone oxidoreductase